MDVEESLLSPFPSPPRNQSPASSIDSFEPVVLTGRTDTMVSTRANAEQPDATIQTPKLGGTLKSDVVWIGGPPKADFSGPFLGAPPTPLCLRNLDAASEIKGYIRRTSGHSVKFKRNDPDFGLMAFADVALQHMQATGMDTVFHMKGVDSDGEGGQELFTFHTRYSKAVLSNLTTQVAQLNQQLKAKTPAGSNGGGGGGDDPKKGIHCFKCGEPGFTKKNCPKCKANANGGGNGDDSKTEKPGPSNNGSKWDAPKPGESHEKMINGVLHHWCAKCRGGKGRWNKNHKTDKHQTGFFKAQRDEAAGASAHIAETVDQDLFSAWADRF